MEPLRLPLCTGDADAMGEGWVEGDTEAVGCWLGDLESVADTVARWEPDNGEVDGVKDPDSEVDADGEGDSLCE